MRCKEPRCGPDHPMLRRGCAPEALENLSAEGSGEVEAIQVHHLGPRRNEVVHELLLRVRARIDLRESAQLRVRTEDQVDTGAGPLELVRLACGRAARALARRSGAAAIACSWREGW